MLKFDSEYVNKDPSFRLVSKKYVLRKSHRLKIIGTFNNSDTIPDFVTHLVPFLEYEVCLIHKVSGESGFKALSGGTSLRTKLIKDSAVFNPEYPWHLPYSRVNSGEAQYVTSNDDNLL